MGDRLVRQPADTGTWLEEFRRLGLGKAPALLRPAWCVSDTDDDLCFGIVMRFELKGPFRWHP